MSLTDDIKKAAGYMEIAVQGLEKLQGLTKLGGTPAAETLVAIDAGLSAILAGFTGTMTADEVRNQITSLTTGIGANDGEALANLRSKFDTSETEPTPAPADTKPPAA